jgi:hypothetical protein
MLVINHNHGYFVFPSGVELGFDWNDLDHIFHDPLKSGLLDANDVVWLRKMDMYPPRMPPYRLLNGPNGGGLIFVDETGLPQPTLVFLLLGKTTRFSSPPGMPQRTVPNAPNVTLLEARGDLQLRLRRRLPSPRYCRISPENLDSAEDLIHWVVDYADGRSLLKGLELLPPTARAFGFEVELLENPGPAIGKEAASWFPAGHQQSWYRISSDSISADFHFAVLAYVAFHTASQVGKRLHSMHLAAQIMGRPHFLSSSPR